MPNKRLVMRQAIDDFRAFLVGEAALKCSGDIVSITVSPLTEWDHVQGYPKPVLGSRLIWIVWMTFPVDFDPDVLDEAIAAVQE